MSLTSSAAFFRGFILLSYGIKVKMSTSTAPSRNALNEPNPMDSPSMAEDSDQLISCPPLKWGILGGGRVANDFVQALKLVPSTEVVAVATRSVESAAAFAEKHKIGVFYGKYDELLTDNDVEIVYVGNVHVFRLEIGTKVLNAGKNLLLEKPFALCHEDAKQLVDLAREKNLFCAEGMWTRYFPAVEKARQAIESGKIGTVVDVASDFHFDSTDSEAFPTSPLYNPKLAGGSAYYLAPYPISAATMCYKSMELQKISAVGLFDKSLGVDLQGTVGLKFLPNVVEGEEKKEEEGKRGETSSSLNVAAMGGTASLSFGFLAETEEVTKITGTKGRITIESPAHCPISVTIEEKAEGRGGKGLKVTHTFPLPSESDEIYQSGGYYYPNSAGFCYEAAAIARQIAAGKTESAQFSLDETLLSMLILDEARLQMQQ